MTAARMITISTFIFYPPRAHNPNTVAPADVAHKSTLLTHLGNIALRTGETIRMDATTGQLAKGSPGADMWSREYEKGWEMA